MEITRFIGENIKLFFIGLLVLAFFQLLINTMYMKMKVRFTNSKLGKCLFKVGFIRTIVTVIFSLILISLFIALQQKYSFIQLGNKDDYNVLVISILTLYGILYAFLQFTIGYASQNENDRYWGRSKTKLVIDRLRFKVFSSTIFKLLLLYSVVYPIFTELIFTVNRNLKISINFSQAFWEVSIFIIYILYAYLFLKSLNNMNILFNIHERRNPSLEWEIEKAVMEEYKQSFKYSYYKKNDYFLRKLLDEVELLNNTEQREMIIEVLKEVFSLVKFELSRRNVIYNLFNGEEHNFDYRSFYYLHKFFNSLYDELEKRTIKLELEDLLTIYRLHDNTIYKILDSHKTQDEQEELLFNELIEIYSDGDNWNKKCTYFRLPSVIAKCISSCDDIEQIHRHTTQKRAFKLVQKAIKGNNHELSDSEKILVKSYDEYLSSLLDCYKNYLNVLNKRHYFYFFGSFNSYDKTGSLDEQTSNIIYEYVINMEYTEQNKEYLIFLAKRLDYKYRASIVFYHMLYTGPSWKWKWKCDTLLFRQIINNIRDDESITDEHVVKFICYKIENSNIGHRIDADLIKWITQQIKIRHLDEKVMDRCLSDRYMSYAKLLKFIYIFSDNPSYRMDFYSFDFNKLKASWGLNWEIEFLREMLETPALSREEFFSGHIGHFCEKISYRTDDFVIEKDFRIFLINPFFKLSKNQFNDLLDNHYLGKGILEFLILHLNEKGYEYLTEGTTSIAFSARVKEIIKSENKAIDVYIRNLVSQASECKNLTVSVMKEEEIIGTLRYLLLPRIR